MEDPGEEWEVEEYYPSSGGEGCKSRVSWILNQGLELGKKVVITGVVISSAPLILPPLVVVSALGFAVSVPFGVVLASYKFTEKFMNKLLPIPASSPLFLEYEAGFVDEPEEDEESEFGGEVFQEDEVKKQIADAKEEVDMGIESAEDGSKEQQEGHELGDYGPRDTEEVEQGLNIKTEVVEKVLVDKETSIEKSKIEKISPEIKRVVIVTTAEKKNADDMRKTDKLVVVARGVQPDSRDVEKVTSNEKDKELKEGTTGLLEKIRDEGDAGESSKKTKKKHKHRGKKSQGAGENKEDKHGKSMKETDENLKKQLDRKGDETIPDAKGGSTKASAEHSMTENVVAGDKSSVLASAKLVGYQGILTNDNHAAENSKLVEVEHTPGTITQGSRAESSVSDKVNSIGSDAKRSDSSGQ